MPPSTPKPLRISVAISLYNEEQVLPELLRRLGGVLDSVPGGPHEAVFVDDGSTDGTLAALMESAARDPRFLVISLSRNFGHQAALSAALDHVTGDATIVMDGDLQDPPEAIPLFLEKHREGFDVVYGRRARRKEGLLLRLSYFLFYRLLATLSDIRLPLDAGDFALLSRRVIDEMRRFPEHHRYLRGLRTWVGFRQIGITIERSERYSGESKYSPRKLVRLALDGIFAFSVVPLRAASILGFVAVAGSLLYAVWAIFEKLFLSAPPRGFPALIVAITFLSGVQLLFLGIIGEYVGRIYEETKGRPHYVISSISRSPESEADDRADQPGT